MKNGRTHLRFARSVIDALTTVKLLEEKKVDFTVLNMSGDRVDTTTPNGKLLFTIMSGFAEFERSMIVTRTQQRKEQVKKMQKLMELYLKKVTTYE